MSDTNQKMEDIQSIIKKAIKAIPKEYYKVKTASDPLGIVRERVFCYELYHLMRNIQDNDYKELVFTLHAEIDKSGNQEFEEDDQRNPDFVFHIPGEMHNNAVVFEVKGKFNIADTIKDFETLNRFTKKYQYKRGIYLFYNYSKEDIKRNLDRNDNYLKIKPFIDNNKIIIICKKISSPETEEFSLSSIIEIN